GQYVKVVVSGMASVYSVAYFFFFSSRRRHTRWPRDWSSDVCSSDLKTKAGRLAEARAHLNVVTNDMYNDLKKRLTRNLNELENPPKETNAPPADTVPAQTKP